jgi:hypothetical protein
MHAPGAPTQRSLAMDDEAIQKGAPVIPPRGPMDSDYEPYPRSSWETLNKDKQHLKTLSIFYFILAGFSAFGAVMSIVDIPLGLFFIFSAPPPPAGPPPALGYFFIGIGIFSLVLNGVYAFLLYLCGKSLRECKRRTLIFVMAILLCMGFPAIILGIFTIVMLNRESVKELFAHGDPTAGHDEDA